MRCTILATALLAMCCAAQVLPDAPTPSPPPKRQTLPHPVPTDRSERPRIVDRGFLIFHGVMFASTAADAITTNRALKNPLVHESNPLLGTHPSPGRVWGFQLGISGGVTLIDYLLERRYPRQGASQVLPVALAVVHAVAAGHNAGKMP